MNTFIIAAGLVFVVLAILTFMLGRRIIGILFSLLTVVSLFSFFSQDKISNWLNNASNSVPMVHKVLSPKSSSSQTSSQTSTTDSNVVQQLISYTNNSSSGPNKNYYWKVGAAQLNDDSSVANGQLKFSADSQGRSGLAMGKLTYQMFADSRGSRQGSPLNPANGGWPTRNPYSAIHFDLTGRTYHGYFYNRSHSIADSLGGTATYTSTNNFTAGSRSQNVGADQHGGMRAAEEIAENYWKANPNSKATIQYQTTPIYNGSEKIPRGSIVNEKSSDGSINVEIAVINDAEGYTINYNTGQISHN